MLLAAAVACGGTLGHVQVAGVKGHASTPSVAVQVVVHLTPADGVSCQHRAGNGCVARTTL
ncbi:MAG: hypothetical protein H6644_09585 [Caldilineaceae bacterium]|nr:hypothetical protein [Caldilineaceae bacterium]